MRSYNLDSVKYKQHSFGNVLERMNSCLSLLFWSIVNRHIQGILNSLKDKLLFHLSFTDLDYLELLFNIQILSSNGVNDFCQVGKINVSGF